MALIIAALQNVIFFFSKTDWKSIGSAQKNCTKKGLNDLGNHDGVVTHKEPDILECKVLWTLGSITTKKASGGDGILAELFLILKEYAVKMLHLIHHEIWKTQQWPQNWKRSAFMYIPMKENAKECSNYHTITLISQTSKVMFKSL